MSLRSPSWLWKRFLAMPPAEWPYRAASLTAWRLAYLRRSSLRPPAAWHLRPRVRLEGGISDEVEPALADWLVDRGDALLQHRFDIFELTDLELGDELDWHHDPRTGRSFPHRPSHRIDHRDARRYGDVKYVWELNRLQHLVTLALAARLSERAELVTEIALQLRRWRAANPVLEGVNWKSPLELGMRLLSWSQLLFLLPDERELRESGLDELIFQHQEVVRRFYSRHSSANNHLIGEMVGLYVSSTLWETPESARWRAAAKERLVEAMTKQVGDDGVSLELSTEYHLFVTELFLTAAARGEVVGDPFPRSYWRRLCTMLDFVAAVRDRSGNFPRFGDGDGGTTLLFPGGDAARASFLAGLAEGSWTAGAQEWLRGLMLLWGLEPQALPLERCPTPPVFEGGGYTALAVDRGGPEERLAVFDGGALGMPPTYAHGHADALGFWLSWCGQEILVDPGTYRYEALSGWRDVFRSTASHSTVRVDGMDQSEIAGTFLWRHAAKASIERIEEDEHRLSATASHDGYKRLAQPVEHHRTLSLAKQRPEVSILDRLVGEGKHLIELFFHFAPECEVRQAGEALFEISTPGVRLLLELDPGLERTIHRGDEELRLGWTSRSFGSKEPSTVLVAAASLDLPCDLESLIAPLKR